MRHTALPVERLAMGEYQPPLSPVARPITHEHHKENVKRATVRNHACRLPRAIARPMKSNRRLATIHPPAPIPAYSDQWAGLPQRAVAIVAATTGRVYWRVQQRAEPGSQAYVQGQHVMVDVVGVLVKTKPYPFLLYGSELLDRSR